MSRDRPHRWTACRPGFEALEERRLLAQFGVPWHDAKHLTLSFVPDGTSINGQPSDLFQTLNSAQPTADWQREILRAFQTWAVDTHVNFAVTADGGQPFGVPGPDQGDPRFGDIRIGARAMAPGVLSISVPHDPFLSGTWSGDILLNSAELSGGNPADLFPILLHEVGHVLGLDHSLDPASVMFSHLNHNLSLAPTDVAAVQALYGPRPPDLSESPWGDTTIAPATPIPAPAGYDGSTPLFLYADIASHSDVDIFSLKTPDGYQGPLTVTLQTAGVSLLSPHLTVLDAAGNTLGDVSSVNDAGDTIRVRLPAVAPGATYFLEARGASDDVFGIGEYALAASFDARSTVGPGAIDALARQSYSYLSPEDLQAIFLDPSGALFGDDHHTNDTLATATPLAPIGIYGSEAPERVTASLADPTDVDFYRVETPDEPPGSAPLVMTVTVRATEVNGIMPRVSVVDQDHQPVPALVLAHGDGTLTIQVGDARPGVDYFLRVDADPNSGKVVGNYDLDVEYGHKLAAPTEFTGGTLSESNPEATDELVVFQPQLFDFLLAASPANRGAVDVRLSITDSAGRVVATRDAGAGETAGGDPVLLVPGIYRAALTARTVGPGAFPPITFRLYGASLSIPIGPALADTTLAPAAAPLANGPAETVPPALGSSENPYTWLALTLSVPRGPSSLSPDRVASAPKGSLGSVAVAQVAAPPALRRSDASSAAIIVAAGQDAAARRVIVQKAPPPGHDAALSALSAERSVVAFPSDLIAVAALLVTTAPGFIPPRHPVVQEAGLEADLVGEKGPAANCPSEAVEVSASTVAGPAPERAPVFGTKGATWLDPVFALWLAAIAHGQARRRRRPAPIVRPPLRRAVASPRT